MCGKLCPLAHMRMLPLRRVARVVLLLVGPNFLLLAQQNPDCLKRTLVVNVRDRTGKLVDGLNSSSFRASLQGQQVRISSAIVRNGPRRIVLLVDASGSVNKDRKSTRLNSSHQIISYAVFCLKKKKIIK